jgi:hypothetical protein
MSEHHVLLNRREWDADANKLGRAGPRGVGAGRAVVGRLAAARVRGQAAAGGRRSEQTSRLGAGLPTSRPGSRGEGPRPVGLDNWSRQLATAKRFQEEFGIGFPLVHDDAERVPRVLVEHIFGCFGVSRLGESVQDDGTAFSRPLPRPAAWPCWPRCDQSVADDGRHSYVCRPSFVTSCIWKCADRSRPRSEPRSMASRRPPRLRAGP